MKLKNLFIIGMAANALVLTGCSTMGETQMSSGGASMADLNAARAEAEAAKADAATARIELRKARQQARLAAESSAGQSSSMGASNKLFPPNAQAGHCYARVLIPATFKTESERVLIKEQGEKVSVSQPTMKWVEERRLVKEASTRLEIVPTTFKTVSEKIMTREASTKLTSVPATYRTVTEKVLDKAAHTIWKRGSSFVASALDTRTDNSTGEIMCLVEVPASYKTVTRRVIATPAQVKEVTVPAQYKTITRTVVDRPASTREVTIPAKYQTVRVQKIATPGKASRTVIPAKYDTVSKRMKVTDERLEWREVLCDVNMTRTLVSELQRALHKAGYFDSPVDGIYAQLTQRGVNRFARAKGLPVGRNYIALEVADALGVRY